MKNTIFTIVAIAVAVVGAFLAVRVVGSSYKVDNIRDIRSLASGFAGYRSAFISMGVFALSTFVALLINKLNGDKKLKVLVFAAIIIINGFISIVWITSTENALLGGFGKKIGFAAIIGTAIGFLINMLIGGFGKKKQKPEPAQ